MKYKEFLDYLETHLNEYDIFIQKATQYQTEKNAKRPAKGRWNDAKIERCVTEMWKTSMQNLHNTLKMEIKSNIPVDWINFMKNNDIIENVGEGIRDLDFSGDS